MQVSAAPQNRWGRNWVFILAVAGSTIGLGNVWKFPHLVSENGGGAFLIVYLLCVVLLGAPMMMAELALGRAAHASPIQAIRFAAQENGASKHWALIAITSLLTGFLVFAFYSVVSSWVLAYFFASAAGGLEEAGSQSLEASFAALLYDPLALLIWHSAFVVLVAGVLFKGVRGLDHSIRVLMPALLVLIVFYLIILSFYGNWRAGVEYLRVIDFSTISLSSVITALSHAFFTLSLGLGVLLAYGRYLPDKTDIGQSVMLILLIDAVVGVAFGVLVFGFIEADMVSSSRGPGLLFVSLPFSFDTIGAGNWLAAGFFLMVTIAVWTSTVALLEPLVQATEDTMNCSRRTAVTLVSLMVWAVGVFALLSFNVMESWRIAGMTVFDLLDFVSAKILLPVTALLLVVFVGWQLKPAFLQQALATKPWLFHVWRWLIRFFVPVLLMLIVSSSLNSRF